MRPIDAAPRIPSLNDAPAYVPFRSLNSQPQAIPKEAEPQKNSPVSGIALSDGEFMVQNYYCAALGSPWINLVSAGRGYLTVTNKRVIYYGYGASPFGKSENISELPISTVGGVSIYYGKGLAIFKMCLALIAMFVAFKYMPALSLFPIIYIIHLIITGNSYTITIYGSQATGTPIWAGTSTQASAGWFSRLGGQGAAWSAQARPTPDTHRMMMELGAIVEDIKTQGDIGAEKWRK